MNFFLKNQTFNLILFSSIFNFLFLIILFIYWSETHYRQLEILEQNLNLIRSELVILKTENSTLSEELGRLKSTKMEVDLVPIIPENFNDSQLLLTKIIFIVAAILVLTFLIYFFSTSLYAWFYKSVLLNLISITDGFTLKLLSILGCGPVHNVGFTDTAGNNYLVKLALDDSTVQILIKAVNTSHYISVDRYVASLNLSIINLRSQVNAILNSTPPNMGTIADNTEITSLITEFSQLF